MAMGVAVQGKFSRQKKLYNSLIAPFLAGDGGVPGGRGGHWVLARG